MVCIMARRVSKKGGRKIAKRMRRRPRRVAHTKDEWASAKQVVALPEDSFNQLYRLDDIALEQFDRLSAIAQSYQFFRFTKIEYKFLPLQDTFTSTGGEKVPYLYYVVETGETMNAASFNQLRDAGAKPRRLDDKAVTVSWKPKVPIATTANTVPTSLSYAMTSKTSPWLPTNDVANQAPYGWIASKVPHKGITYGVEAGTVQNERTYGVELVVHAQFKKALPVPPAPGVEITPAKTKAIIAV